jgi:heparan-alpha-glucosaminide N-acetyltransferase
MTESDANVLDVSPQTRMVSIDVFRFIPLLLMIFFSLLNERSFKVSNIPSWMWHAHPPTSMTIVDIIFPLFVFAVGMCIPIAINKRLEKTKSLLQVWTHILIRAVSMMLMGKLMAHVWLFSKTGRPIGMSMDLWGVLLFVSFFLIWIRRPDSQGPKRGLFISLRCVGVVLLAYLLAIFRKDEDMSWLVFGIKGPYAWWVLGIIGWAYLVSCAIYIMFRRRIEGVIGCLGLLILVYFGDSTGVFVKHFPFLAPVRQYITFATILGSYPSIATAGIVVSMLCTIISTDQTNRKQIISILVFATGLFIAGFLLSAIGISSGEGRATPTWALYSCTIGCVVFVFLHWLFDIQGRKQWVNFILPLGRNALFVYLLSRMVYPLFGLLNIDFINNYFNSGIAGILRGTIYTTLLLLLSGFLITRCRIVLHL